MLIRLIAVVSNDGFIARYSGDIPKNWSSKEEQNYFLNDMQECHWSVMGRKTHDLSYKANKNRIIFSKSINNYKYINKSHILFNPENVSFNQIIKLIKPVKTICILGGTNIYDYFYENDLINEIIITIEPKKFNKGLRLFSKIEWRQFPSIFVNFGFKIKKDIIINDKGTRYFHLLKN